MFGKLRETLNKSWYKDENNRKIIFITENEKCAYEIFSIYKIPVEDYYLTTYFNSDKKYSDFLNEIKARSIHDFDTNLNLKDLILTLSTCDNNNQYRVVIHAAKIKN